MKNLNYHVLRYDRDCTICLPDHGLNYDTNFRPKIDGNRFRPTQLSSTHWFFIKSIMSVIRSKHYVWASYYEYIHHFTEAWWPSG